MQLPAGEDLTKLFLDKNDLIRTNFTHSFIPQVQVLIRFKTCLWRVKVYNGYNSSKEYGCIKANTLSLVNQPTMQLIIMTISSPTIILYIFYIFVDSNSQKTLDYW